jgi:hypothetical protein
MLDDNQVESLAGVEFCPELEKLYGNRNCLRHVSHLHNARHLQQLHLAHQLSPSTSTETTTAIPRSLTFDAASLSAVASTLRVLDVTGNHLPTVAPFFGLAALEELYAPDNDLQDFDAVLHGLAQRWRRLRRLDIRGNPMLAPVAGGEAAASGAVGQLTRYERDHYRDSLIGCGTYHFEWLDGVDITSTQREFLRCLYDKRLGQETHMFTPAVQVLASKKRPNQLGQSRQAQSFSSAASMTSNQSRSQPRSSRPGGASSINGFRRGTSRGVLSSTARLNLTGSAMSLPNEQSLSLEGRHAGGISGSGSVLARAGADVSMPSLAGHSVVSSTALGISSDLIALQHAHQTASTQHMVSEVSQRPSSGNARQSYANMVTLDGPTAAIHQAVSSGEGRYVSPSSDREPTYPQSSQGRAVAAVPVANVNFGMTVATGYKPTLSSAAAAAAIEADPSLWYLRKAEDIPAVHYDPRAPSGVYTPATGMAPQRSTKAVGTRSGFRSRRQAQSQSTEAQRPVRTPGDFGSDARFARSGYATTTEKIRADETRRGALQAKKQEREAEYVASRSGFLNPADIANAVRRMQLQADASISALSIDYQAPGTGSGLEHKVLTPMLADVHYHDRTSVAATGGYRSEQSDGGPYGVYPVSAHSSGVASTASTSQQAASRPHAIHTSATADVRTAGSEADKATTSGSGTSAGYIGIAGNLYGIDHDWSDMVPDTGAVVVATRIDVMSATGSLILSPEATD